MLLLLLLLRLLRLLLLLLPTILYVAILVKRSQKAMPNADQPRSRKSKIWGRARVVLTITNATRLSAWLGLAPSVF